MKSVYRLPTNEERAEAEMRSSKISKIFSHYEVDRKGLTKLQISLGLDPTNCLIKERSFTK